MEGKQEEAAHRRTKKEEGGEMEENGPGPGGNVGVAL